jgi:hypothetical protein
MKHEGYLETYKTGGFCSFVWYQIVEKNGGFQVEFQESGNSEPNGYGFAVFNTLGAALMYLALAADTVASDGTLTVEAWKLEEEFGTIAGRYVTHKTEGN